MENKTINPDYKKEMLDFTKNLFGALDKYYLNEIMNYLKLNPPLMMTAPGFLVNPRDITIYIGKNHIAIEYKGPETANCFDIDSKTSLNVIDYGITERLFSALLGIDSDSTTPDLVFPLALENKDLIVPTNFASKLMHEMGWNIDSQDMVYLMNSTIPEPQIGKFSRVVNSYFMHGNEQQGLLTRYVQWMDFIPIYQEKETNGLTNTKIDFTYLSSLIEHDCHYSMIELIFPT